MDGHVYLNLSNKLRYKKGEIIKNKPWYMTIFISKEDINKIYVNFRNYQDKKMSKSNEYNLPIVLDSRTDDIYDIIDNIYEHYNLYQINQN